MFPESWQGGEIQAYAVRVSDAQVDRSAAIARRAMAKYPAALLSDNLKAVYYVNEMRFYGLRYGGTNSRSNVYITNRGRVLGFSDKFVEATFHHEFSSILLRNYRDEFDEEEWLAANRDGFKYTSSGVQALKAGKADTHYRTDYHIDGFLNQYGQASIEEDFNTFAEALFNGDPSFWRVASLFPRIERKKDIAISFYQRVHPQFNEGYFLSLVR